MPPKGGSTKLAPPRLPPLPKLRVRRPNAPQPNPCVGIMSSLLGMLSYERYLSRAHLNADPVKDVGHLRAMQRRHVCSWNSP